MKVFILKHQLIGDQLQLRCVDLLNLDSLLTLRLDPPAAKKFYGDLTRPGYFDSIRSKPFPQIVLTEIQNGYSFRFVRQASEEEAKKLGEICKLLLEEKTTSLT